MTCRTYDNCGRGTEKGAGRLIAVGMQKASIEAAKVYGAIDIVSYKNGDIVKQIIDMTNGGVKRTIIAGGNAETFAQAIQITLPMGAIASINFF
ncbi:MAG: zinc-binding dehydrogenase [Campylobacteraceae bacterium]|jgi:Zn-dependent alcohol dehydrogenase|nr:zinc-binding dehydrogenase [Campylobacteraceae bacterium]